MPSEELTSWIKEVAAARSAATVASENVMIAEAAYANRRRDLHRAEDALKAAVEKEIENA